MEQLLSLFHWYGFFIGLGVVIGVSLCERQALQRKISEKLFWRVVFISIFSGVIGARMYHVLTDLHLYVGNWGATWQVWGGGLSIIGAFIGAVIGSVGYLWLTRQQKYILVLLDIVPFGAPVAQAIGRLGNLVNQELYGAPSTLPWAIPIAPQYRLPGYEMVEKYHPLFAYEAFLLLWFGFALWQVARQRKLAVGSGRIFLWYVMYYSFIRFCLDFLRIDKVTIGTTGWGVNQVLLFGVFVVTGIMLHRKKIKLSKKMTGAKRLVLLLLVGWGMVVTLSGCKPSPQRTVQSSVQSTESLQDHQLATFRLKGETYTFEIANSPTSITQGLSDRTEIGSDGMLFLMGQHRVPQFWMKNMQFDLDIIWLDELKVVEITREVPRPSPEQKLQDLPRYSPGEPINMVLEVPAGTADNWKLQRGDAFELVK